MLEETKYSDLCQHFPPNQTDWDILERKTAGKTPGSQGLGGETQERSLRFEHVFESP